ncbi:unnamed protein product, partial [marine sediment metagenome]
QLKEGTFRAGEVSDQNLNAVYLRLDEANKRGEIYDYDVSSIMSALYTGWSWQDHTPEEEYAMKVATNSRWRILDSQGMMQKESRLESYRKKREDRQDDNPNISEYARSDSQLQGKLFGRLCLFQRLLV